MTIKVPWELNFLRSANVSIPWFLMSSYMYYIQDKSLLHDHEYDSLCRFMLANWDSLEHRHKHLISVDDLKAGSGFTIKEEDYPQIVKNAAWQIYNERN